MAGYVSTYALVKAFLATRGYEKVYRVPPHNLTFAVPALVVARIGGSDGPITLDRARIAVDAFTADEDSAEKLGEDVRAALRTRMRGYTYGGAAVGLVETMSAPQLVPWGPNVFRTTASYQLTVHQYVGVS